MAHHYDDGPDIAATNKRIREKEKTIHPSSKESINEKQREIEKLQEEKQKIIKDSMIKNQKAYELAQKLDELQSLRDKTDKEIIETKKELNKYCTHEKIETKTHHSPGSYLDRSCTTETDICVWCGVTVDERKSYGYYG